MDIQIWGIIMRKIKKWKKRLLALKDKCVDFLKDQLFYAQEFAVRVINALVSVLVTTSQIVLFALIFGLASIFGERTFDSFIESKVAKNVVYIRSPDDAKVKGSATGFEVIAKSGKVYTLTNAHVCELQNDSGNVLLQDKQNNGRLIPRHVIEVYPDNDLCLIEGLSGYEGLKLASESKIGEHVMSIGYPLGQGLHISRGRVKNFAEVEVNSGLTVEQCVGPKLKVKKINIMFIFEQEICIQTRDGVMTDMLIYPGNSGSPMVDIFGRVKGVVFASDNLTHWGVSVPFKDVKRLLDNY
jgi:S1-C subfamily serine protease